MRTTGILLIILAHVQPPKVIFNLRTFDVPMMALLLGSSFMLTQHNIEDFRKYVVYVRKRFIRLIIPAWKFITLLLLVAVVVTILLGSEYPFSIKTIFLSYTLISGFGYVWIIRIFFTVAVISPLIVWLVKVFNNIWKQALLVIGLIIIQEILFLIFTAKT